MEAILTLPASELAQFSSALRTVVAASGRAAKQVLRGEAGAILKTWAGRTKVASLSKAETRARVAANSVAGTRRAGYVTHGVTINSGIRGGAPGKVWLAKSFGSKIDSFRLAGTISREGITFRPGAGAAHRYHFRADEWAEIMDRVGVWTAFMRKHLPAARKAIGLARQSVVQIADSLGLRLENLPGGGISQAGIAKARAAIASNGRTYTNGMGRQVGMEQGATRFFIELINNYPRGVAMGMDRTLAGVIMGRNRYFQKNLEKGVFLSQARTAKAYPFLQVAEI